MMQGTMIGQGTFWPSHALQLLYAQPPPCQQRAEPRKSSAPVKESSCPFRGDLTDPCFRVMIMIAVHVHVINVLSQPPDWARPQLFFIGW